MTVGDTSTKDNVTEFGPGHSTLAGREDWQALPRRKPPRRVSPLFAIRTPIPQGWRWVLWIASVAVPLLAWTILSATGAVEPTFLPSPKATIAALVDMIRQGELFTNLWATTGRILYGFGLAVLISVPLGIVMGTFQSAQALLEPLIGLVRYLPASAFIPLLLIWLGTDEAPKIALIALATVFFNLVMTADVVRNVPQAMINVSYTLGATRGEVLRKVVVPHALPGIIDAVRVNVAAAWNFVVVAEVVASTTGLGRRIIQAQRFLQTDKIFAVLVVIAVLGVLIDVALRLLRSWVGRWVG
jgi:NitT/TauT family transport system permease protein